MTEEINQLIDSIKNTTEYIEANKYKKAIDNNKVLKKQLEEYLSKQKKIQAKYKNDERVKNMESLIRSYSHIFSHEDVIKYNEASYKLNTLVENIFKSIETSLQK